MFWKLNTLLIISILCAFWPAEPVFAQSGRPPGSLDRTFSNNGLVKITADVAIEDLLIQPDGKILLTGTGFNETRDVFLRRHNSDGSLDSSFSEDGRITTTFGPGDDEGIQVLLLPDGRIVVVALTVQSNGEPAIGMAGFLADGSPDTQFGTEGESITRRGRGLFPQTAGLLPDGKIVAAGWFRGNPTQENRNVAGRFMARFNADGSPDYSFGARGMIYSLEPGPVPDDYRSEALDMAVQPDGKILLAGMTATPAGTAWTLDRYYPDGSLELSFRLPNAHREPECRPSCSTAANAIALQADGKILLAGSLARRTGPASEAAEVQFYLIRYLPDGSLDVTFNGVGAVLTPLNRVIPAGSLETQAALWSMAVQPDGKIVVGGAASGDFALVRYQPDGSPDVSFDRDGLATADFKAVEWIELLAMAPDGKIVAAGRSDAGFSPLARFIGGP